MKCCQYQYTQEKLVIKGWGEKDCRHSAEGRARSREERPPFLTKTFRLLLQIHDEENYNFYRVGFECLRTHLHSNLFKFQFLLTLAINFDQIIAYWDHLEFPLNSFILLVFSFHELIENTIWKLFFD